MDNLKKLAACLAETYDLPIDNVMDFKENISKLKTNLEAWEERFEKLNVVARVLSDPDGISALLVIEVRNHITSYLEEDSINYTWFKFGNLNVIPEQAPEKFMITVDRGYDEGEGDSIFLGWIRQAFPGSSPELSIADFYNQLVNLEERYKNSVPSIVE